MEELVKKVLNECFKQKTKIISAESCTGGLVSGALTSVAGSSNAYDRGFITYSNASKNELLGVQMETLKKFGAVSEEVVIEMAKGALKEEPPNRISIAITGVAGPDSSEKKPVGLVWIGSYQTKKLMTRKLELGFLERDEIRSISCLKAITLLYENLKS